MSDKERNGLSKWVFEAITGSPLSLVNTVLLLVVLAYQYGGLQKNQENFQKDSLDFQTHTEASLTDIKGKLATLPLTDAAINSINKALADTKQDLGSLSGEVRSMEQEETNHDIRIQNLEKNWDTASHFANPSLSRPLH